MSSPPVSPSSVHSLQEEQVPNDTPRIQWQRRGGRGWLRRDAWRGVDPVSAQLRVRAHSYSHWYFLFLLSNLAAFCFSRSSKINKSLNVAPSAVGGVAVGGWSYPNRRCGRLDGTDEATGFADADADDPLPLPLRGGACVGVVIPGGAWRMGGGRWKYATNANASAHALQSPPLRAFSFRLGSVGAPCERL